MTNPSVIEFRRFLKAGGIYDLFLSEFKRIGPCGRSVSLSGYLNSLGDPRLYVTDAFCWDKSVRSSSFWRAVHFFWLSWFGHLDFLFSPDLKKI